MKIADKVVLKTKEDKRIRDGHLWGFSKGILERPKVACGVLFAVAGKSLGTAFYYPDSLLAAHLLRWDFRSLNADFFSSQNRAGSGSEKTDVPTRGVLSVGA